MLRLSTLLILLFIQHSMLFSEEESVGHVVKIQGEVTVNNPGRSVKEKAAYAEDLLFSQDKIKTGRESSAELLVHDNVIALAEETKFNLTSVEVEREPFFELIKGAIFGLIAKIVKDKEIMVVTPNAVIGMRGTAFGALYEEEIDTTRLWSLAQEKEESRAAQTPRFGESHFRVIPRKNGPSDRQEIKHLKEELSKQRYQSLPWEDVFSISGRGTVREPKGAFPLPKAPIFSSSVNQSVQKESPVRVTIDTIMKLYPLLPKNMLLPFTGLEGERIKTLDEGVARSGERPSTSESLALIMGEKNRIRQGEQFPAQLSTGIACTATGIIPPGFDCTLCCTSFCVGPPCG